MTNFLFFPVTNLRPNFSSFQSQICDQLSLLSSHKFATKFLFFPVTNLWPTFSSFQSRICDQLSLLSNHKFATNLLFSPSHDFIQPFCPSTFQKWNSKFHFNSYQELFNSYQELSQISLISQKFHTKIGSRKLVAYACSQLPNRFDEVVNTRTDDHLEILATKISFPNLSSHMREYSSSKCAISLNSF